MKIKSVLGSMVLCLMSTPCMSLQTYNLIDQQKTQAVISKDQQTRIAVEEDRIQQIFGAEGLFDIQSDDERGQIFLKPLSPENTKPISITIVTEAGLTQDLRLMPQETEAQSILFKPIVKKIETPISQKASHADVVDLLKAMRATEEMDEYERASFKEADRTVREPLKLEPILIYRGEKHTGRIYRLINVGDKSLTVTEKDLSRPGDVAVSLERQTILPHQTTSLYVISKTGRTS